MWTRSVRLLRPSGRMVLAASILLLTLAVLVAAVAAQEGGNQAGLVIRFGDGSVRTACVDLGPDGEATGEELLRSAGFAAVIDYSSGFGGGTVCKIGNQGCDFPAEECFCECTMKPGDPCIYWTYFHLVDGQWRYSNLGGTARVVKPGDIDGWVWGSGNTTSGVQPPLMTLEQICGSASQATSLPPATATVVPPSSPTSNLAVPTATRLPTDTPSPSPTPSATTLPATVTSRPTTAASSPTASPSPVPSLVATHTPNPPPPATATLGASATPSPQAIAVEEQEPTASATAADLADDPVQQAEERSGSDSNYIVFGALLVLLAGGLIFVRLKG